VAWWAIWLLVATVALRRGRMLLLVATIRRLPVVRLLARWRPAIARVGRLLLVLLMRRAIVMLSLLIRVLASIAWIWGVALGCGKRGQGCSLGHSFSFGASF
jgi:hypothetical protein